MRSALVLILATGCRTHDVVILMDVQEDPCPDLETSLALDEPAPGGFSADEVLASWGESWSPTARWADANIDWTDTDALDTSIAAMEGTAVWHEPENADDPQCDGQDAYLRFDLEVSLGPSALAADGLLEGWMAARSLALDEIELSVHGTLTPSSALETAITRWQDERHADWDCPRQESCEDWDGETWRLSEVSAFLGNTNQSASAAVGVLVETPDGSATGYDALSGDWE